MTLIRRLFGQLYKVGGQKSKQGEDNIRFATDEFGFVASSWIARYIQKLIAV